MDKIRNFAYGLCCISIVCAVFAGAVPKFGEKAMKFITGLIIMLMILSFPLKNDLRNLFSEDFSENKIYNPKVIERADEILKKTVEENIKSVINRELISINIIADEINVNVTVKNDHSVEINYAEIILPPNCEGGQKEAEEILNALGIKSKTKEVGFENEIGGDFKK